MKPIGPLMTEHKLIERMVRLLDKELQNMKKTSNVKTNFISIGTDFFRIYADRTRHGKEEDILFKELSTKRLSAKENQMLERLIQAHIWARQTVTKLSAANSRYVHGDTEALKEMVYELEKLVKFYPLHIEKEDKHFFVPVMAYFSETEQRAMLEKFWEFDRKIIHEKYKKVVEEIEKLDDDEKEPKLFLQGELDMKKTLPEHFNKFVKKYPEVWQAHQKLTESCAKYGPLDRKTRELIKVAVSGAANQETAVERHAVMAVQEGAKEEEVYQAILLLITTVGFPRASAALKWAERALTSK